ncbi:integral membrane protein [Colletotrichum sojae]|uniref:Integral membrane protein n=1 Tax=Colletotrichum sojae TaxID=2175907 RepID=A0A8H6MPN2_9PEZI|nr:integral membrane protein [Colletotrichum sojae]
MADSLNGPIIGATVAMMCLTTLVISVRMGVRASLRTYGVDDILIAISWVFTMVMCTITLVFDYPDFVDFAFNLCTDLILFIQPMPSLWRLQLPLIKRLGLIAMLSLGLMVCAISILRMHSVTKMGLDDIHDLTIPVLWSEAEVSTLIVCSCVPSLRKAAQKI